MKKIKDNDNNVEEIRNFFKKNSAKNHPIERHPLAQKDEYVRNLYLDMLCTVAQYENTDTENALRLIQRIAAGCNDTMDIQDHIRRSMELSVETVAEFVQQCREHQLAQMYIADSLLLVYGDGIPDRKRLEYVCETADALGVKKIELDYISSLISGVLRQRIDVDIHISEKLNAADRIRVAREIDCYMNECHDIAIEMIVAQKGDIIELGSFGGKIIEWIVLKRENQQLFLLCKEVLCQRRCDSNSNNWKSSELREWLNDVFYEESFEQEEKNVITQKDGDYITLLTKEEVESMIRRDERGIPEMFWWLRSPGDSSNWMLLVPPDGSFYNNNVSWDNAVRPALWINLKS